MFLSLKRICTILFLLIFSVSFCFATSGSKVETSGPVTGDRVSDSGSFALVDGFEFTEIWVFVQVCNGNPEEDLMTASGYIHLNNGDYIHKCVASTTCEYTGSPVPTSGATSCDFWYYTADSRYNSGSAVARLIWLWEN